VTNSRGSSCLRQNGRGGPGQAVWWSSPTQVADLVSSADVAPSPSGRYSTGLLLLMARQPVPRLGAVATVATTAWPLHCCLDLSQDVRMYSALCTENRGDHCHHTWRGNAPTCPAGRITVSSRILYALSFAWHSCWTPHHAAAPSWVGGARIRVRRRVCGSLRGSQSRKQVRTAGT